MSITVQRASKTVTLLMEWHEARDLAEELDSGGLHHLAEDLRNAARECLGLRCDRPHM